MTDTRNYHHGDLRVSLIREAMDVARSSGPDAIGVRELARAVGVSPNAAYRHFAGRDEIIRAAANTAQGELARSIRTSVARMPDGLSAADASVQRLRLIGLGYIAFARQEPGWFTLAFTTFDDVPTEQIVTLDDEVVEPFKVLLDALDAMVEAGVLRPERRPNAEWPCWAGVHGFADIVARGPLRGQPDAVVDALAAHVVDTVIGGIIGS